MNIAIILAAGDSERLQPTHHPSRKNHRRGINKIFYRIRGKPLIFYTISAFEKHPQIKKIILVVKKTDFRRFFSLIKKYKFKKIAKIVGGEKERQDSAFNGLKAVEDLEAKPRDLILFHNGANPLVSQNEITNVIKTSEKYKAALVGQPARNTIKEVAKDKFVIRTVDRKKIFLAQTPQAIEYNLAKEAFEKAFKDKFKATDDVSLVERLGKKVKMVPCSYKNIKVTTKEDLEIIKRLL